MKIQSIVVLASAAMSVMASAKASTVGFNFTPIIDDVSIYSPSTAYHFNNNGDFVIQDRGQSILELVQGDQITTIVGPEAGGIGAGLVLSMTAVVDFNDQGQAVFSAFSPDQGANDIYFWDGQVLVNLTERLGRGSRYGRPGINNNGDIVFIATNVDSGENSVFAYDGTDFSTIATSVVPLNSPDINDLGHIAYQIATEDGQAIEVFRDGETSIALETGSTFEELFGLSINNRGDIVLQAALEDDEIVALFVSDGDVTEIISTADEGGGFPRFPSVDNNGDIIIEVGFNGPGEAVFSFSDGVLANVIMSGDELNGMEVTTLDTAVRGAGNDFGEFLVEVGVGQLLPGGMGFQTDSRTLFLVTPTTVVPLPNSLPLFLSGLIAFSFASRRICSWG